MNGANTILKDSVTAKAVIILVLLLLLMIPAGLISDLVEERQETKTNAFLETSEKWGASQSVNGPILYVPVDYYTESPGSDSEKIEKILIKTEYLHILPERLAVIGEVIPVERYKSIYKFLFYRTDLEVSGTFVLNENTSYSEKGLIRWSDAVIVLGFSDMKSIKEVINLKFGATSVKIEEALSVKDIYSNGLSSKVGIDYEPFIEIPFSYSLKLDGSCDLLFTPLGKTTSVSLNSKWAEPNFTGNFLPGERSVSKEGFSAEWNVMHLNRDYPQSWFGQNYKDEINRSKFGVKLILPIDDYRKISRAVKYMILFTSLTFLMFFLSESVSKRKIHPVQYGLVGLSLALFFVLLLSFTEHSGFLFSYIVSSLSTIVLIGFYSYNVIKSKKFASIITSALTSLYIFLFVLLENQDYSLLFGSIGLFIALTLTMYATRNTDWYCISEFRSSKETEQ